MSSPYSFYPSNTLDKCNEQNQWLHEMLKTVFNANKFLNKENDNLTKENYKLDKICKKNKIIPNNMSPNNKSASKKQGGRNSKSKKHSPNKRNTKKTHKRHLKTKTRKHK